MKKPLYLIVSDFDNCLFKTFDPSPSGLTIPVAYQRSIKKMFGRKGEILFQKNGGLRNRSPGEVIDEFLSSSIKNDLIQQAKTYISSQKNGKKICQQIDSGPLKPLTEQLVKSKISIIRQEIIHWKDKDKWPQPFPGVIDFFDIFDIFSQNKISATLGIISSGHKVLIKEILKIWNIYHRNLLFITDDDMRKLPYLSSPAELMKPSPLLFAKLHFKWLQYLEKTDLMGKIDDPVKFTDNTKKNIFYIGDDANKDGLMAQNYQVLFGWFKQNEVESPTLKNQKFFSFYDWRGLVKFLKNEKTMDLLKKDHSWQTIFQIT